jgi:threonyl-tRNA synthetase
MTGQGGRVKNQRVLQGTEGQVSPRRLKVLIRFSTRPQQRVGSDEVWGKAEHFCSFSP